MGSPTLVERVLRRITEGPVEARGRLNFNGEYVSIGELVFPISATKSIKASLKKDPTYFRCETPTTPNIPLTKDDSTVDVYTGRLQSDGTWEVRLNYYIYGE